jgi:hypothetical protein
MILLLTVGLSLGACGSIAIAKAQNAMLEAQAKYEACIEQQKSQPSLSCAAEREIYMVRRESFDLINREPAVVVRR